jgi:Fe-S-cluster containining protein
VSGPRRLPVFGGRDEGARTEVRTQVADALARGADRPSVIGVIGRAVDAQWKTLEALGFGGEPAPACAPGCSACCSQRVELTAPEVVLLARWIESHPDRAAIARRVEDAAQATRGHDRLAWRARPVRCPLLDARGLCAAYEARPLACRRAHSTDAAACLGARDEPASVEAIPRNETLTWNLSAIVVGALEGLVLGEEPPHHHELSAALAIALGTEGFEARLAGGEDLLAPARSTSADELAVVLGVAADRPG